MSEHTLIKNGSVFDGTGSAAAPAAVLISGEHITATGADAVTQAKSLNDVASFDATGMTVMPGLIDAHCHITFDEVSSNDELFFHRDRPGLAALIAGTNAKRVLQAGVTGMFDADGIFELGYDIRDAINAGVIEGPRMKTGGYALLTSVGGTAGGLVPDSGIIGYGKIVRTRDEIIIEVRRQIKAGTDWIKVHVTGLVPGQKKHGELQVWSDEELQTVCDAAHDLGIPVVGHCRGAIATRNCAKAGFDMILHATLMDDEALDAVVKANVPIVPTFTFQANLIDYGKLVGANEAIQDLFRREIDDSAGKLREAFDAGVPLLCGSESGFSVTPYGEWHWKELEVFVKNIGLSPEQALRSATYEGARVLDLEGEVGEIAAGKLADLIVIDGDPTKDVTILGHRDKFKMVMKGGRPVDLDDRLPPHGHISGWRVNDYGRIIDRDLVAENS
jgi:imidazolonepropionase-like amidohydrolase